MKAVFRNMCSLSETMPEVPSVLIQREQYLDFFDEQFKENRILCVSGESGVGLSTVLALYAYRHANTCVSYFHKNIITPNLKLRDLEHSIVRQLSFYLDNLKEFDSDDPLTACLYKVTKKSRKNNDFLYFVFDGFDMLPVAYEDSVRQLLSQLYGIENARFLFSGKLLNLKNIICSCDTAIQTNSILRFTKSEVKLLLNKYNPELNDSQCDMLYELCHKGKADRLSIIVDKLSKGNDGFVELESLYQNNEDDLFANEIETVIKNAPTALCLSLLTYSEYPLTYDMLAKCLATTSLDVQNIIMPLGRYVHCSDGTVTFKSDLFRKYLVKSLQHKKNEAELLLISLLEQEGASESFEYLPTLYWHHNQKSALVGYLTSERVQQYLESYKSQAILNQQCEYGYKACDDFENQIPFYFRFAINRSASREIEKNDLADSEIEALISVGEFEKAFALTQNVFLLEDKLKCLLVIARCKEKFSEEVQLELETQIKSLIKAIKFEQIPDKAIELAKLMLPVNFAEALSIIDRVAVVSKNRHQLDRLYAAISISYNQEGKEISGNSEKEDLVEVRIVDDELRQMATAMKSILSESSVEQVILEMEKLPSVSSKLYFLQFWIPNHKNLENVEAAILYALGLVVRASSTIVPKVSLVHRYCDPLKDLPNNEVKINIIKQIDALTSAIKYPTIEFVDLQLLVAQSLLSVDESLAKERIQNLYLEVLDVSDKSIRVHCKSLFLRDFDKIGAKRMEDWLKPSYDLQKEITEDLLDLLSKTAYHIKVVEGPIKTLVCTYPTLIQTVIASINTEQRRCRASLIALSEYISQIDMANFSWKYFKQLFDGINYDKSDLEKPIRLLSKKILEFEDKEVVFKNIKVLCGFLNVVEHAEIKCAILSSFYVWMCQNGKEEDIETTHIKEKLDESWEKIGLPWVKVEVGYQIARRLSKISMKKDAHDYIEKTTQLRDSQILASFSCASAYSESLELYEHSLGLLIRSNICERSDEDELKNILSYDDAHGEALIAWARIALEYNNVGNHDRFMEIAHKYLSTPYKDSSVYYQKRVLYHISPALYLCGSAMLYERIKEYDVCFQNLCIENVSRYIRSRYPYFDYSDDSSVMCQRILLFEDYEALLDLMDHSLDECFIYDTIDSISKELKNNRSRKLSREQILIIKNRMLEIISRRLPMCGGIQHDGYKIICKTIIEASLSDGNIDVSQLQKEIECIVNIADQAFLYSNILGYLKKNEQRDTFLKLALEKADEIENMFDKMNRFNMCLLQSFDYVSSKSGMIAKKIMDSLNGNNNGSYQDYQRFIDVINDHDPSLAEDMIDSLDNDPARVEYRKKLKKRISSTKRINTAQNDFHQLTTLSSEEHIRFFDKQMDYLVKKKNIVRDIATTEAVIDKIYENPITEMQTAIIYFMENLYEKNCLSKQYYGVMRENHQVLLQNLKLVLAIAAGTQDKLSRINRILNQERADGTVVLVGEGKVGFDQLIKWFKSKSLSDLRIIDPYFHPTDLSIIKSFMDINNSLHVSILTHKEKNSSLELYQSEWNKISSSLPGYIEIRTVCFEDSIDKCPIHDRWWILYDNENDIFSGKRLASPSTFGSRETEISDVQKADMDAINNVWIRYVVNGIRRIDGRSLLYDNIIIK